MHRDTRLLSIAGLAAVLMAFGCASTAEAPAPSEKADRASPAGTERKAEISVAKPGAPRLEPVYFDTDRALLRDDAREALKRHAEAIKAHPEWGVVTIEGHCDERGSEEYNLALGGRRAHTVARYLKDLGVPASRLETRTYGEAHPAVAGHDESAWRLNRRSELKSGARDSAQR